jgi:hypothetical protein
MRVCVTGGEESIALGTPLVVWCALLHAEAFEMGVRCLPVLAVSWLLGNDAA